MAVIALLVSLASGVLAFRRLWFQVPVEVPGLRKFLLPTAAIAASAEVAAAGGQFLAGRAEVPASRRGITLRPRGESAEDLVQRRLRPRGHAIVHHAEPSAGAVRLPVPGALREPGRRGR